MLPYGRQSIAEDDIEAVIEVLRSDWLTQGPAVERFEQELAAACGARYAVAVANGTAALHLACLAAGLGPGDVALAPSLTFVASANCALYCGARPVLLDIDSQTLDIDAAAGDSACQMQRVKVVVPVHFGGLPCDMERISASARRAGAVVIEDACHALGARWRSSDGFWHQVGDCSHSNMVCFSFHPVKHITTGEGGAILTNDAQLCEQLRLLRTHGITRATERLTRDDGPWYYEMQALGFNYRITDLQCALGYAQLRKLRGWVARRRQIAARYRSTLSQLPYIGLQAASEGRESSYHLFVIQVPGREEFYRHLRENGLGVQVHYVPIHLQPYYREHFGYKAGDLPKAEAYYRCAVSIPIFPAMSDEDVERVVRTVLSVGREMGLEQAREMAQR
jgi:UDP-4-amino-4,6-dideoxy-N-acetyl-beta-L-altrosamine transaminase